MVILLPLLFGQRLAQGQHTPRICLHVLVTGIRNDKGQIAASLFAGEKGFPDDDTRAVSRQTTVIKDHSALLTFDGLMPGKYALALLHDENKNHKMDMNRFGFPREGYGVSNNPRPTRRGPKFSDAEFSVPESHSEQTITVKIIYLQLRDVFR